MRILAIDTALGACSAAVLDTARGALDSAILARESLPMLRGHAEALIPLIERIMEAAGTAFADLGRVAVTTGPGSFTGLRVGIAAARGFGLAGKIPVVGVSTLQSYAAPYLAVDNRYPVIAAIDARHRQVYLQVFTADGRSRSASHLAPLAEATSEAAEAPARIVGSAAEMILAELPETAAKPVTVDGRDAPDIAWVAQIGAIVPEADAPPKPQYLRAADAQPQNAASLPRR